MSPFDALGASEQAEAAKSVKKPEIPENIQEAAKTRDGSRDLSDRMVNSTERKAAGHLDGVHEKSDPRLAALRGKEVSAENLINTAPELVFCNPEIRKKNPALAKAALEKMVTLNPAGTLPLIQLYEGPDRNQLIATALSKAMKQDPRSFEFAALLPENAVTPQLRADIANAKKRDTFAANRA